jgi:alkaline phosphatase D
MAMKTRPQHWFDLFGERLNRRDFIKVSRDAAVLVGLGALPAAGQQPVRFRSNPFALGVASGDPSAAGVVLWTRLDREALNAAGASSARIGVRWEVAEDDSFRRVVRRGSSIAGPELGHSVHVEVERLRPGRDYWYRFTAGGEASATGRTRTAPAAGASPEQFRFAFVSCQNYEQGYYTAYHRLASEDLDAIVHLGDYIYEARTDGVQVRQHEAGEVFSLEEYRARYVHYRSDHNLQAAHALFPWIVTMDDHEVVNNYAGSSPSGGQSAEQLLLRRAAAYQAFYEFMPVRISSMPRGPDMNVFRRLGFGDLVAFHVLDTRQYRAGQACGGGVRARCEGAVNRSQTMMGAAQEKWLMEGLTASNARWNVLANQVMMAQVDNGGRTFSMDKWDGYVDARNRLLAFLAEARPSNPIAITGDVHASYASDLKTDFDDPSSPIIGSEFVGTSISSGGDGHDGTGSEMRAINPHLKFFNARRGYVRATITPSRWVSDYRVIPYVSRPGAPVETRASFVVEHGRPGVQPA